MSNAEIRRQLTTELKGLNARITEIRTSFPKELACLEPDCFEDAAWVRSTQFSGDFPYCDCHARKQDDFGKEDASYFFWQTVPEFLESLERQRNEEKEESSAFLKTLLGSRLGK